MALQRAVTSVLAVLAVGFAAPGQAAEGVTAESLFERAETLYRQLAVADPEVADSASWDTLASTFAAIPERFPTHPISAHALWRLGEIRLREHGVGQRAAHGRALAAYEMLTALYPTSRHAPRAYLRLAELSSPAEAQTHYYRLLRRYPGSAEAEEARQALARASADDPAVAPPAAAEPEERGAPAPARTQEPTVEELPPPDYLRVPVGPDSARRADHEQAPTDEVPEASPTPASRTSPSELPSTAPLTPSERTEPGSRADLPTSAPLEGSLLGLRHYSDDKVTRVVLDLDRPVQHAIGEAQGPPRVFVDLIGARLPARLPREEEVGGPGVQRVRVGVNRPGVVRVVLDLRHPAAYSFFTLTNPDRLVVDIPNAEMTERLASARRPPQPEGGAEARQLSLGVRKVVIDPGHGGDAPGAVGPAGVTEKELTLDIAHRLAANLRSSGYEVMLTRDDDRSLALEERPSMATAARADLFVSIHVNSSTNRQLSGFETYYLDLATDPGAAETAARENAGSETGLGDLDDLLGKIVKNANKRESRDLAHSIQDSLVLQLNRTYDNVRDLGVKHAPFVVLVGAAMPAVLVECSFLSHEGEQARLRDAGYRQQVADAIHIGIENYVAKRRMISATH